VIFKPLEHLLAEWDTSVLVNVTLHRQKEICCPMQVWASAFKNKYNLALGFNKVNPLNAE